MCVLLALRQVCFHTEIRTRPRLASTRAVWGYWREESYDPEWPSWVVGRKTFRVLAEVLGPAGMGC